ncbi:MAG: CDP-diacylglycerol---glycerol-3-phosphate 3-phosphatidyltransferase, partial [Solirubrobacteraceae bacterium]|nr:CDP-diacylglycerol---glycerol-3-phosphate 3-phosphatidyltransferase [Solirubrobacteraceae bacterium]
MAAETQQQQPTEPGPPSRPRRNTSGAERLELLRARLIASRLTPNAISLTGFALNVLAAALIWQTEYFWGGVAFIVGSIMDTLDGGYSRMSGKG